MADKKKWIKLWPEGLMTWEWFNYPGMLDFWVRLLMLASKGDGVIVTTERELSLFCHVTRQQLRTMLANLKSTKEITKEATNVSTKRATKITICKWESYQGVQPRVQPSLQPKDKPSRQPQINQCPDSIPISSFLNEKSKHNIEKREEKETTTIVVAKKEAAALSLAQREKIFYDSLIPFLDSKGGQYSAEMLRAFYNHWSEANEGGRKMRFEMEKTWNLKRRLQSWNERDKARRFPSSSAKLGKVEQMEKTLADSGIDINEPLELI